SELGGRVLIHSDDKFGKHLRIDFRPRGNKIKPVLLLGHMDTVYPIGTISKMPCRVSKGRVWGPGVLDMKAGIALALHVIEAMLEWNKGKLDRPVKLLVLFDEGVGRRWARAISEASRSGAATVVALE